MTEKLLNYFGGDDMAASTWLNKYAQEGDETPDDMHRRMAKEFARMEFQFRHGVESKGSKHLSKAGQRLWLEQGLMTQEQIEENIYSLFKDFKYIVPQGSVMSGAGNEAISSLSNCFVIGQPKDSYGGIFLKEQEMVQLMKRRGGVGIDLSTLRPKSTPTSNAAKSSTGMTSFMGRYSNGTREVAQDGRRGALMLSVDVKHPDSLDFIKIKRDTSKVTGANISVKIGDEFMQAVQDGKDFMLTFPVNFDMDAASFEGLKYDELQSGWDGKQSIFYKKIKATEHWNEIIKSAHQAAEPGILFWDNIINNSPDGVYSQYRPISTNPCGEVPMQPYDACRLIAPNLYSMVKSPFTQDAEIDYDLVYNIFYMAQRLSDDLVELELEHIDRILDKIESDPEPEEEKVVERNLWKKVKETAQNSRRTGLGYTALGDMVAAIGLKYDSDESIKVIEKVMKTKFKAEWEASIDMSILRGSFDGWNPAKEFDYTATDVVGNNEFYQMMVDEFPDLVSRMIEFGRRNVSLSTLAPTGTVSMMTQTTSGVEPVFAPMYGRRRKVNPNDKNAVIDFIDANGDAWEKFMVIHPKLETWIKLNVDVVVQGIKTVKELTEEELKGYYELSPYYKATANDIDWIKRVEIQAMIQRYTSHSISSTINLPRDVSEEVVGDIYMESWKQGLKGITVYRDGSRDGVLITEEKKPEEITKFHENHAPTRPKYLDAKLVRFNNNKEKWIAFVGFLDGKPYEIFTGSLEEIKIPTKIEEGQIVKVIDENGVKKYDFIHEEGSVLGINAVFNQDYWNYAKMISSTLRHGMPLYFAVEMVKGLTFAEDHINTWKNGVARALKKFVPDGEAKGLKCNDCGSTNVIFEEGCHKCRDCGSSKCG